LKPFKAIAGEDDSFVFGETIRMSREGQPDGTASDSGFTLGVLFCVGDQAGYDQLIYDPKRTGCTISKIAQELAPNEFRKECQARADLGKHPSGIYRVGFSLQGHLKTDKPFLLGMIRSGEVYDTVGYTPNTLSVR